MLFGLIQSLTKAEKRNFKLYIRRLQKEGEVKFFHLFEILEKWDVYDEGALRKQLKISTTNQLSNLKRNLYHHILTSLRLIRIHQELDIQIRELINNAQILYSRGLYLQALRLLHKAKTKALDHHRDLLLLEIVEFEKRIESRHITRSTTKRMEGLIVESKERSRVNARIVEWSNLKLELQRLFINQGHVRNEKKREKMANLYRFCFSTVEFEDITFFEKIHYYEARYWLHYVLLDMETCRSIAQEWVQLYAEAPKVIEEDVDSYFHALHALLIAAYYLADATTFREAREELEQFVHKQEDRLNENSQVLAFLYTNLAEINQYFITGELKKALLLLPRLDARIRKFQSLLDPHKVHLFYYKMAWINLTNGRADQAISYLQEILNSPTQLRDDIVIYARMQLFMAHYDLNNLDLLDYILAALGRQVRKSKERDRLQKTCLRHFKKLITAGTFDREERLKEFRAELAQLQKAPFLRRAFLYLDVPLWVESKLARRPMSEVVTKGKIEMDGLDGMDGMDRLDRMGSMEA
jgi:hypothetical protein